MITIEAEVIHGRKIGRALGFPTANMSLEGYDVDRGVLAFVVPCLVWSSA